MGDDKEDHEGSKREKTERVLKERGDMEEMLLGVIEKFNDRAEKDEKLQKELNGVSRKIQMEFTDGKNFHFVLEDTKISNFGEGDIDTPDITIISDTKTVQKLFNKEMGPMKALATKRLKLQGSLQDMLKIRKLF
jgi:putative sterol carrier protein